MIAERWNLSPRFSEIIHYHHAPAEAPELPKAASVVCVADGVASWLLKSDEPARAILELDEGALGVLQLEEGDILSELVEINGKIRDEIGFWIGYGAGSG